MGFFLGGGRIWKETKRYFKCIHNLYGNKHAHGKIYWLFFHSIFQIGNGGHPIIIMNQS